MSDLFHEALYIYCTAWGAQHPTQYTLSAICGHFMENLRNKYMCTMKCNDIWFDSWFRIWQNFIDILFLCVADIILCVNILIYHALKAPTMINHINLKTKLHDSEQWNISHTLLNLKLVQCDTKIWYGVLLLWWMYMYWHFYDGLVKWISTINR